MKEMPGHVLPIDHYLIKGNVDFELYLWRLRHSGDDDGNARLLVLYTGDQSIVSRSTYMSAFFISFLSPVRVADARVYLLFGSICQADLSLGELLPASLRLLNAW